MTNHLSPDINNPASSDYPQAQILNIFPDQRIQQRRGFEASPPHDWTLGQDKGERRPSPETFPAESEPREVEKLEEMRELWWRSHLCSKIANQFYGAKTGTIYGSFMPCLRWWCDSCGKKGGRINLKRLARVRKALKLDLNDILMRQAVFTVPDRERWLFLSPKALSALMRMSERIIKKQFPGLKCVAALHLFGDKGGIRYHPHVHILIFDKRGQPFMLPVEDINRMREQWRYALEKYVKHPVKTINWNLSFIKQPEKMLHRISYLTRPMPGPAQYHGLGRDLNFLYFLTVKMRGFMFIRYFNGCRMKGIPDPTKADEEKEVQTLAGESLIFIPHSQVTREGFDALYGFRGYDELAPGFYRVRGP
ncbi:hypothetical protein ES708_06129 [subsurface metagenome]